MSVESSRIVCTGCDYETMDPHRPILIRYVFGDGRSITTGRDKGWCYRCANYSDIEKMDKEGFEREIYDKENERSEANERLGKLSIGALSWLKNRSEKSQLNYQIQQLESSISQIGHLLEIANHRRSKARCLECGSDKTAKVIFPPEGGLAHDFQHECGGKLRLIHGESGMRFSFRLSTYVLNEEGELLGKE